MSTKFCKKCQKTLDISSFFKRGDGVGFRSLCISCYALRAKEKRHEKNPPKPKLTDAERKLRRSETYKKYRSTDRGKAKQAAHEAGRRAAKLNATPTWLTQDQLDNIELAYALARYLSKEYGQKIEVDHIIPLKGKDVKGLHVPWNLQLMVKEVNQKKGNRLEPVS